MPDYGILSMLGGGGTVGTANPNAIDPSTLFAPAPGILQQDWVAPQGITIPQKPAQASAPASPYQKEDVYDAMLQAGIGLLSSKNLREGLSKGFAGFNKGFEDAAEKRTAARKLSLEELKANRPTITPSGQPGYVIATYPDGRPPEYLKHDDAVAAYQAEQNRKTEIENNREDRRDHRLQAQIDAAAARTAAQIAAANARDGNKRSFLNPTLQKSEDTDMEIVQGSLNTANSVSPLIKDLEGGQLNLGALANAKNTARNWFGKSTPESLKYAELEQTVQHLTNETLRLNKGVQTEGDAKRAASELTAAFAKNDNEAMAQALRRIGRINQQAAVDRSRLIDQRRSSQGVQPLYGGQSPVDPNGVNYLTPAKPQGVSGKTSSGVAYTIN